MSNLSLEFAKNADGKTFLENQYASYPFHVCKTQYYENDPPGMANIYIQSASGGIYENETLTTNVIANTNSYSHVTTQASTIVHGMPRGDANQNVNINTTKDAYTEFISDPLILFPESKLNTAINVIANESGTAIIADAFLLHFLKGNEYLFNQFNSKLQIFSEDKKLLAKDVYRINPKNFLNGKRKYIGMGTITVVNRSSTHESLLEALHIQMQTNNEIYGGISSLPNNCGIIMKFLASDGDALKSTTLNVWMIIREMLIGEKPKIRRK